MSKSLGAGAVSGAAWTRGRDICPSTALMAVRHARVELGRETSEQSTRYLANRFAIAKPSPYLVTDSVYPRLPLLTYGALQLAALTL